MKTATPFLNVKVYLRILMILAYATLMAILPTNSNSQKSDIIGYIIDPQSQDIRFYWKDENGNVLGSIKNLRAMVREDGRELVFAMNGGIYMEDRTPLGLFIQEGIFQKAINRSKGFGNFYIEPNGIFYITSEDQPGIVSSSEFKNKGNIKYATQSGPMLVVDGRINEIFRKESESKYIRNGVGILPGSRILFAISRHKVNFYSFAEFFLNEGCETALYLDGFVSEIYLPEKHHRYAGGNFGVIIGETRINK